MAQRIKRDLVRTLLETNKLSPKEISEEASVSLATVYNVKNKLKAGDSLEHAKGGGRPGDKQHQIARSVAQYIKQDDARSVREIASEINNKGGLSVSKDTVHRCLRRMDYSKPKPYTVPMLSNKNRLKRLDWAKKNKRRMWSRAIFADEASFWLSRGKIRMWTKSGQKKPQYSVKHSAKEHVWAAFSSMGTFPLCVFTQNMDTTLYLKILEWHLLRQAEAFHEKRWYLVQDNDPKHTSRLAKRWMDEKMPNKLLDWPSQSPDVNPIENIFGWLKYQLARSRPRTISELKAKLVNIWESLSPKFLEPYWKSMPKRCQMLLDNQGNKIKY